MSNVVEMTPRPSPEEEAAAWIARIDAGPLSPAERERLNAWLDRNPLHRDLLDDHARTWALAMGSAAAETRPASRSSRGRVLGGAVAASLVAVFAGVTMFGGETRFENRYATRMGERRTVALPDGSRALLNTGTRLQVAFDGERRLVTLTGGEAMFDVAHDADRTFEVEAGGTVTRAIGTRFVVRMLRPREVSVVVTEGLVRVRESASAPSRRRTLDMAVAAGQQAVANGSSVSVTRVGAGQIDRATGWTEGGVPFRNERLADVLAEVNRYAGAPVSLADPALGDLRVSGYLAVDNVPGFLSGLSAGAGLRVRPAPDGGTLIEKRS